jgi:hypothetical protein
VEKPGKSDRWSPVEIKTILVLTDLQPESMIAIRYALTLAKQGPCLSAKSRKAHLEENNLPLRRLGNAEFPKNVAAENQPTTT